MAPICDPHRGVSDDGAGIELVKEADKLAADAWRVLCFIEELCDLLTDSSILVLSKKYSSFLDLSRSLLRSLTKFLMKLAKFSAQSFGDDIFIDVS